MIDINLMLSRQGCCEDWPKPCSYHEGVQDAMDYRDFLEEYPLKTLILDPEMWIDE